MTEEIDNENAVAPTRSLFGSAVRTEAAVSEPDTVAAEPATERTETEEAIEDAASFVDSLTVPEAPIAEEPEPVVAEPEEAVTDVEVDNEELVEEPVEVPVESPLEEAAVASTEVMEDTTLSATDTVVEPETAELAELDVPALKAKQEKISKVLVNKQEEVRRSVISQIAAIVKLYDIPLLELFKSLGGVPNPRKGEKAPITHKDDKGNTWTGRGKTPKWLRDKNPDDYRV